LNQEEIAKFAARIISILVKCGIQYGPKYAVNKMFDNKIKTASKGKFKNISDFVSRIDSSKVNKRVIETLIKSGAFDCFNHSRKAMLLQLEDIVESAGKSAQAKKMAIGSLFGDNEEMKLKILDTIEFLKNETELKPKIFENASKEHPEKRAIYIEFHDSYDKEGEVFFDELLTKLNIKRCY